MVDFASLRRTSGNNMASLQRSLEKSESGSTDPRLWKYGHDQNTHTSVSIIRFLPASAVDMEMVESGAVIAEDLTPLVKVLRHSFKAESGRYFNKNSPQTFGLPDPIRDWTGPQWGALKKLGENHPTYESTKNYLKEYIPDEDYYANILVLSDSVAPENNGKVKLFKFGRAIRKFIEEAQKPKFGGEPFDVFDPWTGRNLELKLSFEERNFGGRTNWVPKFDAVTWSATTPIFEGDEAQIERVWRESFSLQEFLDKKHFLSYEDLKTEFCSAMNFDEFYNPIVNGMTPPQQTAAAPAQQTAAVNVMDIASAPASGTQSASVETTSAAATAAATPSISSDPNLEDLESLLRS